MRVNVDFSCWSTTCSDRISARQIKSAKMIELGLLKRSLKDLEDRLASLRGFL